ncbi:MAG: hypothetical protein ACI9MC_000223 [Kiritimatiellia bacterium]|jgi:hypothetical protein
MGSRKRPCLCIGCRSSGPAYAGASSHPNPTPPRNARSFDVKGKLDLSNAVLANGADAIVDLEGDGRAKIEALCTTASDLPDGVDFQGRTTVGWKPAFKPPGGNLFDSRIDEGDRCAGMGAKLPDPFLMKRTSPGE